MDLDLSETLMLPPFAAIVQTSKKYPIEDLHKLLFGAQSTDYDKQLNPSPWIGESSSKGDPGIEELVRTGAICHFFDFFDQEDLVLKIEAVQGDNNDAVWRHELSNYGNGHGSLLKLVSLFRSSRNEFQQLALWASGFVADSRECSDLELSVCSEFFGALHKLIDLDDLPVLRIVSSTLYKFCADLDPNFCKKQSLYCVLERLLLSTDVEVLVDACWALASTLNQTAVNDIQYVIHSQICPLLVSLITHHSSSILIPVLDTLGIMVFGTAQQTQFVIQQKVLPKLKDLLSNDNIECVTERACFCIATITSCGSEHVRAVIDAELVAPLFNLLERQISCEDALLAILNCATYASPQEFNCLFNEHCIKPLCDQLASVDFVITDRCLRMLELILSRSGAGQNVVNEYKKIISDVGGLHKIRQLQFRRDGYNWDRTTSLLSKYWQKEQYEDMFPEELRRFVFAEPLEAK